MLRAARSAATAVRSALPSARTARRAFSAVPARAAEAAPSARSVWGVGVALAAAAAAVTLTAATVSSGTVHAAEAEQPASQPGSLAAAATAVAATESASASASASAASPSAAVEDHFQSAQPYSDPTHPGLTLLVADMVPELVWRRDRPNEISQLPAELARFAGGAAQAAAAPTATDATVSFSPSTTAPAPSSAPFLPYAVLLSVYDPACSACATQKPVLLALAEALTNEPAVRVMSYDASANNKHGFLTPDELKELPLIKLFPALPPVAAEEAAAVGGESAGARASLTYTGAPNARSLVDFIAAHTPSHSSFDAASAHARLAATASKTDAALREAADARLQKDPVFHVYAQSPCGPDMMRWMKQTLVTRYLHTPIPDEEQQATFAQFQQCMQKHDKQMKRYWQQLALVAQDNLVKYDEKEKRQQQQQQ